MEEIYRDSRESIELGIAKPLQEFRQELRQNQTPAEKSLWGEVIREKRHNQWRIQEVFGWFILDFVIPTKKLAIELDGAYHDRPEQQEYDQRRDEWLQSCGLTVARFSNEIAIESPQTVFSFADNHNPKKKPSYLDLKLRATSLRRSVHERELAAKGLMHIRVGTVIAFDALGPPGKPDNRLQLSHVRISNLSKCQLCQSRVTKVNVRCPGCFAIVVWDTKNKVKESSNVVLIRRSRVVIQGQRLRPKCPCCSKPVAMTWERCQGCGSKIVWE